MLLSPKWVESKDDATMCRIVPNNKSSGPKCQERAKAEKPWMNSEQIRKLPPMVISLP